MTKLFSTLIILIFLFNKGFGENEKIHLNGHVHEAFMNVETPVTLLITVAESPPPPLKEILPPQNDPDFVWVAGYWEWSEYDQDYVWCSGSWRKAPPHHKWIAGKWIEVEGGWTRVKGFWSKNPESHLSFIPIPPPDQYDETPSDQPGNDYFWMSGYWNFQNDKYTWLSGKWERYNRNWVYVPAKYIWRPDGYTFVAPFWDWPIDQRGIAYACVIVPEEQQKIAYVPEMIMEPLTIVERCLLVCPDYYYFYDYYSYFHPDWWSGCAWCPPWWGWNWGVFPWQDQWALWWWWTHPNFPAPIWLNSNMINAFPSPPMLLIQAMQHIQAPLIVTNNGVIPPGSLLKVLGNHTPVFPINPNSIQNIASEKIPEGSLQRPNPERLRNQVIPPRPHLKPAFPPSAIPGRQPSFPQINSKLTPSSEPKLPTDETIAPKELPKNEPKILPPSAQELPAFPQPQTSPKSPFNESQVPNRKPAVKSPSKKPNVSKPSSPTYPSNPPQRQPSGSQTRPNVSQPQTPSNSKPSVTSPSTRPNVSKPPSTYPSDSIPGQKPSFNGPYQQRPNLSQPQTPSTYSDRQSSNTSPSMRSNVPPTTYPSDSIPRQKPNNKSFTSSSTKLNGYKYPNSQLIQTSSSDQPQSLDPSINSSKPTKTSKQKTKKQSVTTPKKIDLPKTSQPTITTITSSKQTKTQP